MKNCTHCKHAEWKRTAAGSLHPSGDGRCTYPWKCHPLPACMYFINPPIPSGGYVNRKQDLKDHCTYYAKK